jgi:hypothetical protein
LEDLGLICGVAAGTVHVEKVERGVTRVAGSRGTPATGLRPQPTREKGFPSNLLLALIISPPYKERIS